MVFVKSKVGPAADRVLRKFSREKDVKDKGRKGRKGPKGRALTFFVFKV